MLVDGSSNIIGFTHFSIDGGRIVLWDDPPVDVNVTNLGTTAVSYTLSVPPDKEVLALLTAMTNPAESFGIYISSLKVNDEAPTGFGSVGPFQNVAGNGTTAQDLGIFTNTSKQIRARASSPNADLGIATRGWKE